MSLSYKLVLWNGHKKRYDWLLVAFVILFLLLFNGITLAINPVITPETLIIRSFATLALLLLHIILIIGPLSRIDKRFLVLLYNRRHLGVTMFIAALIHGLFSLIQFHALGNVNLFYSLFASNLNYLSITDFPFQVLGFFSLLIFLIMAATSHDFWLHNLSPKVWKGIHMTVYLAYIWMLWHVFLGALQHDGVLLIQILLVVGFVMIAALHIAAGLHERKLDQLIEQNEEWQFACRISDISESRAFVLTVGSERAAIFKYNGYLSAVSNVCKHQNGPLGEGKVIEGCITCPWHGYQYLPAEGKAPAPFTEKIPTYNLKLKGNKIYIQTTPNHEGVSVTPLSIANWPVNGK